MKKDAQTEALAIVEAHRYHIQDSLDLIEIIAAALATRDAEIARLTGQNAILDADGIAARNAAAKNLARAETAESRVAELEKALEPFANTADHDIGLDEADTDVFTPMTNHNSAMKITVGHMRAASRALIK